VLINLNGGNDGLNTVIPFNHQKYYDERPVLSIKKPNQLPLTDELALHPSIPQIQSMYRDGTCAIIGNVGYPDQDRSHFRSSDIWHSASDASQNLTTGWTGRYLDIMHPEYPASIPLSPFAIQVSSSTTLLIQGPRGSMGMALDSPDRFYDLQSGLTTDPDPVPPTPAGENLTYLRQVIIEGDIYSTQINKAIAAGTNKADYADDILSQQLKGVARLINGGLGTTIYVVTLAGFDTHYRQPDDHAALIGYLAKGVKSFLDDMNVSGNSNRVVCLTYSEFGRRLAENGQAGTDHGAAAPQLVFGKPVLGGNVLGGIPDLDDLDSRGDVKMTIDFRQIYATVLEDWLGFSHADTTTLLGREFAKLPLFGSLSVGDRDESYAALAGMRLDQNAPNPVHGPTTIGFRIPRATRVRMDLFTTDGRHCASLVDRRLDAGEHEVMFDTSRLGSGIYLYTTEAEGLKMSKRMMVVR
jgi:uncharacterized protein (DUF1501 family)